ncbi:MAG: hypothetical protein MHM6MM_008097, partial [Cercozoa sp. M6MM]
GVLSPVTRVYASLRDGRDACGVYVVSHLTLLLGVLVPALIGQDQVEVLAGIISVGIGDAAAAIGGSMWGRHKWLRPTTTKIKVSSKSIEGSICMCISMLVTVFAVTGPTTTGVWGAVGTCVLTSVFEALCDQSDNLFLPLVFLAFWRVFQ